MHKNASIWCDGSNHFVLEVKYYAFICNKKKKKSDFSSHFLFCKFEGEGHQI